MSVSTAALTLDSLRELPDHARRCVFWELDPTTVADSRDYCDAEFEKEAWLSTVMLQWGSCGQLISRDGRTVGYALYAPPSDVPRSLLFPTSPVSPDAVLLTTMKVEDGPEDYALSLIQSVVRDLVRRGVRALEAFGVVDPREDDGVATSEWLLRSPIQHGECSVDNCMIEAELLEKLGFSIIAPHHRFPRLRLELDRDLGWKASVEYALERLLETSSITLTGSAPAAAQPVGVRQDFTVG